jgi:hypothetical protein
MALASLGKEEVVRTSREDLRRDVVYEKLDNHPNN